MVFWREVGACSAGPLRYQSEPTLRWNTCGAKAWATCTALGQHSGATGVCPVLLGTRPATGAWSCQTNAATLARTGLPGPKTGILLVLSSTDSLGCPDLQPGLANSCKSVTQAISGSALMLEMKFHLLHREGCDVAAEPGSSSPALLGSPS